WLVGNIPPNVTEVGADAGNPKAPQLPRGALQTRTDFGTPGYGGPGPPAGDHPPRYLFTGVSGRAGRPQREAGTPGSVDRVSTRFQYAGQGGDHGPLQAVTGRLGRGRLSLRRRWAQHQDRSR